MLDDFLKYSLDNIQFEDIKPLHLELANGVFVELVAPGVVLFSPTNLDTAKGSTKSIVLSAGIHGNETAPIEMLNAIIRDIGQGLLTPKHNLLMIFGNLQAIMTQQRFIQENLNRLFEPTVVSDSTERKRARQLMQAVDNFFATADGERLHYDMHTAIRASKNEKFAVYPYLHGREYSKSQLSFLSACEINTVLLSQSPTSTFSYYSSFHHNAHAFTLELGKVRPFGQNDMTRFRAIDERLRHLITQVDIDVSAFDCCPIELFIVNQTVIKQHDDFKLHFADDTPNFTGFKKGAVLASEQGIQITAQVEGEAIVFPNANVPIGQRALLTVRPYAI